MSPGQLESDKDRLLLIQDKEQLLRELRLDYRIAVRVPKCNCEYLCFRSITPRSRSRHGTQPRERDPLKSQEIIMQYGLPLPTKYSNYL